MKRRFILSIVALFACFASHASILGPSGVCVGGTAHLTDSLSTSGTWWSTVTSVATVDASGNVTGVSAGTTVIYFMSSLVLDSVYFTVSPAPAPISASSSTVCIGGTITLTDATPGGTWLSGSTFLATISAGGTVYGVNNGTVNIYYTTGAGCGTFTTITVGTPAVDSVSGPSSICVGSSGTMTDITPGGTWNCSPTTVATINAATGMVWGVGAGTAAITYTVSNSCGSNSSIGYLTVTAGTATPTIGGPATVAAGSTITEIGTPAGGTWSCTPATVATINATTGVVTGVSAGSVVIVYTITGCSGTATATRTITVTPFDGISGNVNFGSISYYGQVKVWLIKYVAPMLTAVDSTTVYCTGSSVHYQFSGATTDTYRVKAATLDSTFLSTGGTGYIPTYHTSSFYWYSANVIPHISGTSDVNKDINMAYGSVTSGPGFIGGDVTTGANKGTASGIPVQGLMMYLFNSTTLTLIQAARTDATGAYSFSNLPVGQTYYIFPDSLNYLTTPFTSIALTASAPSMTAASFIQHTISHTITPGAVNVENVSNATASILAFPNPTNGRVNIAWSLPSAQAGTVIVADITGREVFRTVIDMNQGAGASQVDLSTLTNGLYLISVKSANVNYNNKIQVQH